MRTKRSLSAVLAVVLAVTALTACTGGTTAQTQAATQAPAQQQAQQPAQQQQTQAAAGTEAAAPAAPVKDTLVFGVAQEPTTMDTIAAAERITYLPTSCIFDRLIQRSGDELVPMLAESWEVSDDGLEYVFKIREGVKFHKGQTLTADDVEYSLQELVAQRQNSFSMVESVEKVDDTHVKMTLKYAYAPILNILGQVQSGIVCKEYHMANDESRDPNGTGAFIFKEWISGDSVTLVRNEEYWKGPAPLREITFRVFAEESTELIALQAGELDAYITVAQSNKPLVQEDENLAWYEAPGSQVFTLAFNNGTYANGEKSIFADNKALRQAICYAIDKEDLVIGAIEGSAPPLYTPYPLFVANYPSESEFNGNLYNPELAKQKLAEAGYPNGLDITIITTPQQIYAKPAEIIQGQLSQIGINLKLETLERGTYLQDVYNNFNYDMTVWAVSCDFADADPGMYQRFYSGNIKPAMNYMQVNDPELDEAIMTNRTSQDPAARKAAVLRMAEIIRDENYGLPLYASPQTLAANKDLEGVNLGSGMDVDFFTWKWSK